ncbi:MAG TPA: AtpZ/AtpI family protein [Longimicrobiales bacterium]|nr:AtpZ/AtpI family protein [Longimicrobiales bacterium]
MRKISQADKLRRALMGKYLGLGMTWALATLLFLWLGTQADKWLGTEPALTFIGAFVGAGAGFYYMYRQLTEDQKKK